LLLIVWKVAFFSFLDYVNHTAMTTYVWHFGFPFRKARISSLLPPLAPLTPFPQGLPVSFSSKHFFGLWRTPWGFSQVFVSPWKWSVSIGRRSFTWPQIPNFSPLGLFTRVYTVTSFPISPSQRAICGRSRPGPLFFLWVLRPFPRPILFFLFLISPAHLLLLVGHPPDAPFVSSF